MMKQQMLIGGEQGWWFVCHNGKVWLPDEQIPFGRADNWDLVGENAWLIGEWQGEPVWLVNKAIAEQNSSVRQLLQDERQLFQLAGRAVQLAEFFRSHKFCGYCGYPMHMSQTEWACLCANCRERYYPQIAPCIIVAIHRGPEILLAQHSRHRSGIQTVLAGFVEVGETLEEAVHREVMEESGIVIGNLRYVASQPWPFPHSLMMGYMADYVGGEIVIDPKELKEADWFHYNKLPINLPPPGTMARRLIEDMVALCRAEYESPYKE